MREELLPGLWQFEDDSGQLYLAVVTPSFKTGPMVAAERREAYVAEWADGLEAWQNAAPLP